MSEPASTQPTSEPAPDAKSSNVFAILRTAVLGVVIVLALLAGIAALGGGSFLPFDYEGF